ncbi:MAG: protein kinase, partial [Polyangiaceae bacterium]
MTQHLLPEQGCITRPSNLDPPSEREPASSGCLHDDEVVLFVEGALPRDRLELLEAHLDSCATCQHLINAVARALDSVRESTTLGGYSSLFAPGSVVANRYRIERFLARGGMGEVYEAFDQELSERVALKTVVSTACDSPRAERKLKGEVQLARRISHPNVCRIYDLGVHEPSGGRARVHFLTMEFIEGESLGRRLKSGPLPSSEASAIARQLLGALAAAHEAGVLHRDFKSDNVMLRRTGSASEAVITDFGLARALDPCRPAGVSDSTYMVGSPAYMAPEQVMGHELGAETDVFAFGVVFFEMLTGKLPFEGESAIVAAMSRLSRAAEAPSSVLEGLTRRYDELVLKCLQRERKRRFADARSALAALEALPPSGRLLNERRGRREGAVLSALVALAGGAALYVAERGPTAAPAQPASASAHAAAAPAAGRATATASTTNSSLAEEPSVNAAVAPPLPQQESAPSARAEAAPARREAAASSARLREAKVAPARAQVLMHTRAVTREAPAPATAPTPAVALAQRPAPTASATPPAPALTAPAAALAPPPLPPLLPASVP